MARIYAGILGLLAFATVVARGIVHAAAAADTIWQACGMLLVFAGLGGVIGQLARWIVDDSIRNQLAAQLAAKPTEKREPRTTSLPSHQQPAP
jgi:hypothetical protein